MEMTGHSWEKNILVEEIGSAKAQGSGLGLGTHFSGPEVLEKGLWRAEWLKQSGLRRRFVEKILDIYLTICVYMWILKRLKVPTKLLTVVVSGELGKKVLLFKKQSDFF